MRKASKGFSLVELLVALALIAIFTAIVVTVVKEVRYHARKTESTSNIRQLVIANHLYASDHGNFAPWSNTSDNIHWHGERKSGEFVGTGGYLSPYLDDGKVRMCPVLEEFIDMEEGDPFDEGTGGYGYNATYIGGYPPLMDQAPAAGASRDSVRPWWSYGAPVSYVMDPAELVMFTSSAIVRGGGIVETGNSVPYRHLSSGGGFGELSTPTVHFRFRGLALVAWADGHITFEAPNEASTSQNVYGDENSPYLVGWFGPIEWNGYWNPRFRMQTPY